MKIMKCIDRLTVIRRLGTLCAILMLAASSSLAQTVQNVTLAWDASPDASVVGYILRYGIVGGISTNSLDVANQTTGTASNLNAGTTVFFFVTAYNAQRLESLPSNLITYTVPGVNNTPPTISSIANQTIAAGRTTGPISFTVGDMDTPLSSLTLSGNSSNPTLVPSANIVFGGSGANRTVTVTPTAAQTGTATITVSVSDGSASTSKSFAVTVLPNTPPTISSIPNQVITANTATPPIPFVIGDAETPVTGLVLSRSSSNPTLVPSNNIVFGGSGTNRTVTVTPAANQSGAATVTVTLSDGTTNASKSFLLTVVNALGAPTFVYLPIEAESATIASPMAIASDPNAGQGQFIQSTNGLGAATFTVNIPLSGVYSVWCRILSPNSNQDSFYVSVDGGAEDIFDTATLGHFC